MAWRKWIVRGIVYGILGAAGAAALLYQRWTNPTAVREQVIAQLGKLFPGALVSVDSARLRILGGIQLINVRLARADDPERHEFLHIPSAIFYHDKEKILDGELKLRKIELVRPRLRVRRGRDGKWNLHDLLQPTTTEGMTQLPTIVIQQGTLILEDRLDADKPTTLEINDVSLTLINDPLPRLTVRGAANSELLGKLQLQGALDRRIGEAMVSFRAAQIPLTQTLVSRLPIQCPSDFSVGLQLNATANIEGKISYQPNQAQPVYYDAHCEIVDGSLKHPNLPLPLENLHVKLHCSNGELELETLRARSGTTEVEAHGVAHLPCPDQEFEVHLALKHVMLGHDLAERLPVKMRDLHNLFQPDGPTSIHIHCARHEGQWVDLASGKPSHVSLRPEDVALAFKGFPYPLERTTGSVDYNLLNQRVDVDLKAHAHDRPVILSGHWTGAGEQADVKLDIVANDVPIDDKLSQGMHTDALENLRKFGESFHATGKLNVRAHISHKPGHKFRNEFHLHFHDMAICWEHFPYPLKNVSGTINIYPEHWEFHEFQGVHNDGHVLVNGKSIPKDDKGDAHGISLEIIGRNVQLDDDLREALRPMPGLYKSWETFRPQGNLFFTASVNRPTADINDLEVRVDARGSSATPTFFPYLIQEISGQFQFHHQRLEIGKLRAKHNQAIIAMDRGIVDLNLKQPGGYYADLSDVQIRGLQIDDDFIKALPTGKLQEAAKALNLKEPLRVTTRLVVAQAPETGKAPDIFWDGKAEMFNANLTTGLEFTNVTGAIACLGRYDGRQIIGMDGNAKLEQATFYGQPFKKVHAKFQMREQYPGVLLLGLRAPIFGGDVVGQIGVDFNSALRYEMNLTASQINVAEFGQHNLGPKSQISGAANARLYLKGVGTSFEMLEGNGAIDIPRGHIYNLPFLLDLLKFLGLHWPDRTAFEEFHTAFNIQGSKVNVKKIDLLGSAVSLSGKGEFVLGSKELQLDVYPMWGRIEGMLPAKIRPLPTTLSKNLLTVEVRGKVTPDPKDLKFHMKPVPAIVDPLLLLRDRVVGPQGLGLPPLEMPRLEMPRLQR